MKPEIEDELFRQIAFPTMGSLHADLAFASWATLQPSSLLLMQIDVEWQQGVLRLIELGSGISYQLASRLQGQWAMSRVTGPGPVARQFTTIFSADQTCHTPDLRISVLDRLTGSSPVMSNAWTIEMTRLLSVGLQREAGPLLFMDQVAGQFSGLKKTEN